MGREFELKFSARPEQLAALREKFGDFCAISMETTYYDTPNGDLSARRITLRRRLENGLSVCTVKTPGDGHSRGEWDAEADTIRDAIPLLRAAGCTVDLETLTKAGISPICGARFIRLAKTLEAESCRVELALDQGCLMGGGKEIPSSSFSFLYGHLHRIRNSISKHYNTTLRISGGSSYCLNK